MSIVSMLIMVFVVNSLYFKKGGQCSFYCRFPIKSRFIFNLDTKNRVVFDTTQNSMEDSKMTEREKMLAGELYDCGDPELLEQWHLAKNLIREYNALPSENLEEKDCILNRLLGGRGDNLWIPRLFMWIMGTTFTSEITVK